MDYTVLRNDIIGNADLSAFVQAGSDNQITDYYNTPQDALTVTRASVDPLKILSLIDRTEYAAMSPLDQLQLQTLAAKGPITDKSLIDTALATSPKSQAAVNAYYQKNPATQAEALFGDGTLLIDNDIALALNGDLDPIVVQVPTLVLDDNGNPVQATDKDGNPLPDQTLYVKPSLRAYNATTQQYDLLSEDDAVSVATAANGGPIQITPATPITQPITLKPAPVQTPAPTPPTGVATL